MPDVTVAAAEPDERVATLRLAFRHLTPEAGHDRIAVALDLIDRGELDPDGLLLARRDGQPIGAMIAVPVPGAGAAIWPPQVEPFVPDADAVADRLVRHAADWLRARGTKLAQTLLAPEDTSLAAPLLRNGFTHPTALWHLRHNLDLPAELLGAPERLTYQTYASADPGEFTAAVARTYEASLDCPEINGARTPAEVLAGHGAAGNDRERWWLARSGGVPVGVLLVGPAPEGVGWEVSYVGVVPEARRRGVGRELLRKALFEAKAAGQPHLGLSVDARNHPARELYRRLGFEPFECREVFLAVWSCPGDDPPPLP
jgi:ribosomal protein S18 acetylase RimI-like enzyme